jgi:1,5-anhydro-D-fructose reductase (1,5-anhydro-D-mannitol-forming)
MKMAASSLKHREVIEDNVFVNLRDRQTGVVASLHSTITHWRHMFSIEVFFERGYMVINGLKTSSGSYGDEVVDRR